MLKTLRKSIVTKYITALLLLSALISGFAAIGLNSSDRSTLFRMHSQNILNLGNSMVLAIEYPIRMSDVRMISQVVGIYFAVGLSYAKVTNSGNAVLFEQGEIPDELTEYHSLLSYKRELGTRSHPVGKIELIFSSERLEQEIFLGTKRTFYSSLIWFFTTAIFCSVFFGMIAYRIRCLHKWTTLARSTPEGGVTQLSSEDKKQDEIAGLYRAFRDTMQVIESTRTATAIARTTQALAHDVRKPFSMLHLVIESISDADNPIEAQEIMLSALPEIKQAMASVDGMIQDVMQIGSKSKPNQEIANPRAIICMAINELFRIFPEAEIDIHYKLNHIYSVNIDTQKIRRVFSNILVNALQSIDAKGTIWIHTQEKGSFIEFTLGNAGSLISKETLPRLFEAFYTSGKKGGTGLGLAIAQKVVNEHGGEIHCKSARTEQYPNGYVEFVFTLPAVKEYGSKSDEILPTHSKHVFDQLAKVKKRDTNAVNADEIIQESNLHKKLKLFQNIPSLLIVDDEPVYRNSLASQLARGDSLIPSIPVYFAKTYDEAIDKCQNLKPFLVIQDSDLGVSSKNGIEVIKEIRRQGYCGRICMHSNRVLYDDQKIAFEAGADSVLPKPMSREHLLKLIDSALAAFLGS
jgi:CheY-like chemotaxis protein